MQEVTTDGGNSTDTEISLVDLNTEETSLHNLGKDVTKIQILTINDSYVPSLRALSSNLRSLQVLKIPNCGIADIDGLAICKQLKEVYLPFNEITSLASLMFLTNLEIIDLESNFIDGISELDYLSCLSNVKLLNLSNNPVCGLEMYEEKIYGHLGSLAMLDDFSAGSEKGSRNGSPSRKKNQLKAQVQRGF
jgi:Leucine-rich repeat (LRR) protein